MLTDQQRIEVCRELWAYWYRSGRIHLDQAMSDYQRAARERLEREEQEGLS